MNANSPPGRMLRTDERGVMVVPVHVSQCGLEHIQRAKGKLDRLPDCLHVHTCACGQGIKCADGSVLYLDSRARPKQEHTTSTAPAPSHGWDRGGTACASWAVAPARSLHGSLLLHRLLDHACLLLCLGAALPHARPGLLPPLCAQGKGRPAGCTRAHAATRRACGGLSLRRGPCVCVCVCAACVRACVRVVCVRACVCACVGGVRGGVGAILREARACMAAAACVRACMRARGHDVSAHAGCMYGMVHVRSPCMHAYIP